MRTIGETDLVLLFCDLCQVKDVQRIDDRHSERDITSTDQLVCQWDKEISTEKMGVRNHTREQTMTCEHAIDFLDKKFAVFFFQRHQEHSAQVAISPQLFEIGECEFLYLKS